MWTSPNNGGRIPPPPGISCPRADYWKLALLSGAAWTRPGSFPRLLTLLCGLLQSYLRTVLEMQGKHRYFQGRCTHWGLGLQSGLTQGEPPSFLWDSAPSGAHDPHWVQFPIWVLSYFLSSSFTRTSTKDFVKGDTPLTGAPLHANRLTVLNLHVFLNRGFLESPWHWPNLLTLALKYEKWKWKSISWVWLFVTPWTVACHAPLSMEFSRQEHWSG